MSISLHYSLQIEASGPQREFCKLSTKFQERSTAYAQPVAETAQRKRCADATLPPPEELVSLERPSEVKTKTHVKKTNAGRAVSTATGQPARGGHADASN